MATTTNRGYPLPEESRTVREEIEILQQQTLAMLDGDIHTLFEAISNLASETHGHPISAIEGLTQALAGKMPANATFRLSDLGDVSGADEAPNGYVLSKVSGAWVAQAAFAALGEHSHPIGSVTGLTQALGEMVKKTSITVSTSAPSGGADGDIHFQV